MNLKRSRFITISLGPTLVKAAQVTSAGVVEKVAKQVIENGAADAAVSRALKGFDIKTSGILCMVPGEVATTKNIEVPAVDHEEIESILALQATRHTPFNKDEILTGYIRIGSPRPNFTRVLLVIVKREAVKEKLSILKIAGIRVDTVLFIPEAVARFYAKAFNVKKGAAPVALIDVGMQTTSFIICAQGGVAMTRSIPVGIEHLAVDADSSKQLIDEIKASLDAYDQEKLGVKPVRFCLTTNHPALAGINASISEALGIKVEVTAYTSFVNASPAVKGMIARDFADDGALDIIASGVAASKCEADLVPEEIRDQRALAEKGRETLKAGLFILFTLLFIGAALMSKVYFKGQFLRKNLIVRYADQRQEVKNLENMISKSRVLKGYLEARNLPLEAIRELFRIIPEEIYLSNISMDDAGDVSIQGISESMSKVFTFVTSLEASPFFEGVKTKSTTAKKDRGKDVAAFEITMKLTPDAVSVPETDKDQKK